MTHTGRLLMTIDDEIREIGPALRVAAKIRPYCILALDGGPAPAFGLGLVFHPPDEDLPVGAPVTGISLATLMPETKRKTLSEVEPGPLGRG